MKQTSQAPMHHLRSGRFAILLFFILVVFLLPQMVLATAPITLKEASATDPDIHISPHDPEEEKGPYEGSDETVKLQAILQQRTQADEGQKAAGLCDGVVWSRAARARSNGLGKELLDPRLGHL